MIDAARGVLAARGVDPLHVHTELFHARSVAPMVAGPVGGEEPASGGARLTVVLDGRATSLAMHPGESVLDAAVRVRGDAPFSCRGGVCGTCRARLVDGDVRMARNWALDDREVEAGFILACQSHPGSDRLTVDFDA
jgi:ring-1,2-phenylacetyl-CoA epoxidase subunit PaaE